ncbi:hypothetical protein J3A72_000474 [Stenotrophomonas sp. PvP093]|uniref:hypothetical protein n=1 Tax=Stenotrophomonas sp. PvP087 TaxID=3156434 RepID=UPI0031C27AED|nr:hypothetical protein [Stenotrophomonas sp. PvP093]
MNTQHTRQNGTSAPATPEAISACGYHVVGRYRAASGEVGVEVRIGAVSGQLTYAGAWGNGVCYDKNRMRQLLQGLLAGRVGAVDEVPFGGVTVAL